MAINLIGGRIMHKRLLPKTNHFNYQSTYIAFSLKEKSLLKNAIFGVNNLNIFAFFDCDHGNGSQNCKAWIEDILLKTNFPEISDIILVAHPRVANYVFNPASFWLCFDEQKKLIGVLVEVNNTFNQRHSYLLYNENFAEILPNQWLEAKKMFHVSPFFPVDGDYKFKFVITEKKMDFYINYYRQNQLHLCTYLKCDLQDFCAKNLALSFLKIPFSAFKVIVLIHFQALKLFAKKIKFHKLNSQPKSNFSAYKNVKK